MKNKLSANSKYSFVILSFLLLIAMILLQLNIISIKKELAENNNKYKDTKKKLERMETVQTYAIGKKINNLILYSIDKGILRKVNVNNGFIAFASLLGCGKCVDHHLEVINKNNRNDLIYVLESDKVEPLKIIQKIYNMKQIYWDDKNSLASLVGFDTRKYNPFLLTIKDGVIVGLRFSYLDESKYFEDEISRLERLLK